MHRVGDICLVPDAAWDANNNHQPNSKAAVSSDNLTGKLTANEAASMFVRVLI